MNELKQALQLAVKALQDLVQADDDQELHCGLFEDAKSAIAAAEAALAQPDPEPVAVVDFSHCGWRNLVDALAGLPTGVALYTGSAQTQSAELATVTADRDQLRADLGELQAKYADACAELAAESVGAGKMVVTLDYLRGLKEHCESLESERDQLRAEVERLQSALEDDHAGESVAQVATQRQPLTDGSAVQLVQSVASTSERPIGMVAYGLLVLRAVERAHGITTRPSQ